MHHRSRKRKIKRSPTQPIKKKILELTKKQRDRVTIGRKGRIIKMGKKYRSQRNRNKNKKKQNEEKKDAHVPYEEGYLLKTVEYGNYKMEAYYALQGIHDTYYNEKGELIECQTAEEKHEERLRWRKSVTQILPASFRIAYDVSQSLKQTLEAELEALIPEEALRPREGEEEGKKAVLKKISFAPHAYQLSVDKTSLRKDPVTEKLHLWLKRQTMAGFITRQETVSMVPPVILAPEPDDVVFDMCAVSSLGKCCKWRDQCCKIILLYLSTLFIIFQSNRLQDLKPVRFLRSSVRTELLSPMMQILSVLTCWSISCVALCTTTLSS